MNQTNLVGNLGADPELRYTQNQTAVATLSVATSEHVTKDGQKQELVEWHRVVVWDKQAENCSKYLSKGKKVRVTGRLQTRSWEDKQTGKKCYVTEIIAREVEFLTPADQQQQQPNQQQQQPQGQQQQQNYGQQQQQQQQQTQQPNQQQQQQQGNQQQFGGGAFDDIPF